MDKATRQSFISLLRQDKLIPTRHATNVMQMIQQIREINLQKRKMPPVNKLNPEDRATPQLGYFGPVASQKIIILRGREAKVRTKKPKLLELLIEDDDYDSKKSQIEESIQKYPRIKVSRSEQEIKNIRKSTSKLAYRLGTQNIKQLSQNRITLPSIRKLQSSLQKFVKKKDQEIPSKPYFQPSIIKISQPNTKKEINIIPQERLTGWTNEKPAPDSPLININ